MRTYFVVPLLPLFGHRRTAARLLAAHRRHSLHSSLLLHGAQGAGKQQLALWFAAAVLCNDAGAPCGRCTSCRQVMSATHPDVHWYFPRARMKQADPSPEDVEADYAEGREERAATGLYAAPSGSEGIYVATVRALLRHASLAPVTGRHRIFVVGDAERMIPQEGAEAAANAFLKLLEEPPEHCYLLLTSSQVGALLPTIRSRVVSVSVSTLDRAEMQEFLAHPAVQEAGAEPLRALRSDATALELFLESGTPGALLGGQDLEVSIRGARRLLESARSGRRSDEMSAAFGAGATGARGAYSDVLDAVTALLHAELREATLAGSATAAALAGSILSLEELKLVSQTNITPQLTTAQLMRILQGREWTSSLT